MSFLRRWVEALESGEYQQAQSALRGVIDPEGTLGYCCMGVAGDLYVKEHSGDKTPPHWEGESTIVFYDEGGEVWLEDGDIWGLRFWLGIDGEEEGFYIEMNDNENKNFQEIAQAVRDRHPDEFVKEPA